MGGGLMDGMKDVGGKGMNFVPDIPDVPGMEETDEQRKARLLAAAERIQTAEWESEIPAQVHKDLNTVFEIVDTAKNGKLSLEEWTTAGLQEDVFYM